MTEANDSSQLVPFVPNLVISALNVVLVVPMPTGSQAARPLFRQLVEVDNRTPPMSLSKQLKSWYVEMADEESSARLRQRSRSGGLPLPRVAGPGPDFGISMTPFCGERC